MSLHQFHSAVELNNEAATNFATGKHQDIIRTLTQALKIAKGIIDKAHQDQLPCLVPTLDDCMLYSPFLSLELHVTGDDAYDGFIYQRPIFVPGSMVETICHEATVKVSVVIMFNLALAHHLLAMSLEDSAPTLSKAVQLYHCAFQLQYEVQAEVNAYFVLATLNNLGLAHKAMGKEVTAGEFFQELLSTAMVLIDRGKGQIVSRFDGFFLNLSCIVLQPRSAPAA